MNLIVLGAVDIQEGPVNGNWTIEDSPYYINGDIIIEINDSLSIEPGVDVIFTSDYSFTVEGKLRAEGTETDNIEIYSEDSSFGWKGLRFINTSDNDQGNSLLYHCQLRDGFAPASQSDYPVTTGGAVYCVNSANLVINNCTFSDNFASNDGGAVALFDDSNIIIRNSFFSNNEAGIFGGALFIDNAAPFIEFCRFENNYAMAMGTITSYMDSAPTLENIEIVNNLAGACAGLYATYNDLELTNILIANNETETGNGGGIGLVNCNTILRNSTLYNNSSAASGDGIWGISGGSLDIINCIFWENGTDELSLDGVELAISYSNFTDQVLPGEGNISQNPNFLDPSHGDYSVAEDSPCIDTGNPNSDEFYHTEFDLNMNPRLTDGDDDGETVIDMGAFEFQETVLQPPENFCVDAIIYEVELGWTAPNNQVDGYNVYRDSEIIAENITSIEYSDFPEENGEYEYYVTAVYEEDESEPTEAVSVYVGPEELLIPENLQAEVDESDVNLTWNDVSSEYVTGYNIYRDGSQLNEDLLEEAEYFDSGLDEGSYEYQVSAIYNNEESELSEAVIVEIEPIATSEDLNEIDKFNFKSYPNPFIIDSDTQNNTLELSLPQASELKLAVYNIKGKEIIELEDRKLHAGKHLFEWNGKDKTGKKVSSGVYFYKIRTNNISDIQKVLLVK